MLNRPTLPAFHRVYEFTQDMTLEGRRVPLDVIGELCVLVALCLLLEGDMRRPWQDVLIATDGSQSYGYGVSMAPMDPAEVRNIGRVGERPNQ